MLRSPVPASAQLVPTSMLWPAETKPPFEKSMHVSVAGRSAKIVYLKLTFPRLKKPPPPGVAVLLLMVTPISVAVPASCIIAAPESALLPKMVTFVRLTSKSLPKPPPPPAELPLSVTRFSVADVPLVKTPPPMHPPLQTLLLTVTSVSDTTSVFEMPPPCRAAVFCVTTTLLRLRVAVFVPVAPVWMPPPAALPGFPLRIVTPEIDVVPLANTSNTRSIPPPSMIELAAPAPVMVTGSVMSRSPVAAASSPWPAIVSVMVPAGMTMVSAPVFAFDAWIAARSVQATGAAVAQLVDVDVALGRSAVLLTVNVFAAAWAGVWLTRTERTTRSGTRGVHLRRVPVLRFMGDTRSTPAAMPRSLRIERWAA